MKPISAYQKYLRQSPRKLRLVANMVRGMSLVEAIKLLKFTPKRGAGIIRQVLIQAQANTAVKEEGEKNKQRIETIVIEEGPRLKRWQPVSRGRAHQILKRMSHIRVKVAGGPETSLGAK